MESNGAHGVSLEDFKVNHALRTASTVHMRLQPYLPPAHNHNYNYGRFILVSIFSSSAKKGAQVKNPTSFFSSQSKEKTKMSKNNKQLDSPERKRIDYNMREIELGCDLNLCPYH